MQTFVTKYLILDQEKTVLPLFESMDKISVLVILKDRCQILITLDNGSVETYKTVIQYFSGISNTTNLKIYNPSSDWKVGNPLQNCVEFLSCIE